MCRSAAPRRAANCCQGTRFEWCSISDSRISSPGRMFSSPQLLRHEVDAGGCARGENDLLDRGGVDQAADVFAGLVEEFVRLLGQLVDAAMDVGIVLLVAIDDGLDDLLAGVGCWRRCRSRPAARPRGPSGRGWGNRPGTLRAQTAAFPRRCVMVGLSWEVPALAEPVALESHTASRWRPATPAREASSTSADWA